MRRTTRPGTDLGLPTRALAALLAALAVCAPVAAGQEPAPPADPVAALEAELAALRQEYEGRIADLEQRIADLERAGTSTATEASPPAATDEAARLRELARQTAGTTAPAGVAPAPPVEGGRGRSLDLNRLNPEVSLTGILFGVASDAAREDFQAQEFELDLQSTLDPFSRTRLTLSVGEEGDAEVEEGYLVYSSLPGGLGLTAGRFRQSFGALNRQHLHALPQTDYPLVLTSFFGDEGLDQNGLSLDWLVPRPWASANEITLQVTDGSNEAFGGEDFRRLVLLGRVKSFWEIDPARYLEWGVSAVDGRTAGGGTSQVVGTDLTFNWRPPARAKYREITWRTAALRSRRDVAGGGREAWGGYSYLEGLLAQNLYLGLRYDYAQDPEDPGDAQRALVPYLTWWQSEFVRLRGEYRYLEHERTHQAENRFVLQLTWAAGPHKHETY